MPAAYRNWRAVNSINQLYNEILAVQKKNIRITKILWSLKHRPKVTIVLIKGVKSERLNYFIYAIQKLKSSITHNTNRNGLSFVLKYDIYFMVMNLNGYIKENSPFSNIHLKVFFFPFVPIFPPWGFFYFRSDSEAKQRRWEDFWKTIQEISEDIPNANLQYFMWPEIKP